MRRDGVRVGPAGAEPDCELPLGGDAEGTFRIDAAYQDKQYVDVQNTPLLRSDDNIMLNASLNIDLANELGAGRFHVFEIDTPQIARQLKAY